MFGYSPILIVGCGLFIAGVLTTLVFGGRMLLALGKRRGGAGKSLLKCLGGGALAGVGAGVALMGTDAVEVHDPKEAPEESTAPVHEDPRAKEGTAIEQVSPAAPPASP